MSFCFGKDEAVVAMCKYYTSVWVLHMLPGTKPATGLSGSNILRNESNKVFLPANRPIQSEKQQSWYSNLKIANWYISLAQQTVMPPKHAYHKYAAMKHNIPGCSNVLKSLFQTPANDH